MKKKYDKCPACKGTVVKRGDGYYCRNCDDYFLEKDLHAEESEVPFASASQLKLDFLGR